MLGGAIVGRAIRLQVTQELAGLRNIALLCEALQHGTQPLCPFPLHESLDYLLLPNETNRPFLPNQIK